MTKKENDEGLSLLPLAEDALHQVKSCGQLNSDQMICPKCSHIQKVANECERCGIIISRYVQKREEKIVFNHGNKANEQFVDNLPSKKYMPLQLYGFFAAIILIVYGVISHQSAYVPLGDSARAVAQIAAIDMVVANEKSAPNMSEIRTLLEQGEYSQVEAIIRDLHNKAMEDILWEDVYQDAVEGMSNKNNYSLNTMNKWVETSGSAISYLARGAYYITTGSEKRGSAYAYKTSDEQFEQERKMYILGINDLQKSIAIDPNLFPAYTLLIRASTARGIDIPTKEYLQKAIEVAPGGFIFRYKYLVTLMPKWGGSSEEMEVFTNTIDSDVKYNPRLWLLKGFVFAEKACSAACDDKDYNQAIKLYGAALQYGFHPGWLTMRAYSLWATGDYKDSLKDLDLIRKHGFDDDYTRQLRADVENRL